MPPGRLADGAEEEEAAAAMEEEEATMALLPAAAALARLPAASCLAAASIEKPTTISAGSCEEEDEAERPLARCDDER